MDLDAKWADLESSLGTRNQEGGFQFHPTKDGFQGPVSPIKDLAMTLFYFAVVCAGWGGFFWWLLA